tara:strand:- start:1697 stop:2248 length:552 start_codon:yes stop_codon:yes gene_type:complete
MCEYSDNSPKIDEVFKEIFGEENQEDFYKAMIHTVDYGDPSILEHSLKCITKTLEHQLPESLWICRVEKAIFSKLFPWNKTPEGEEYWNNLIDRVFGPDYTVLESLKFPLTEEEYSNFKEELERLNEPDLFEMLDQGILDILVLFRIKTKSDKIPLLRGLIDYKASIKGAEYWKSIENKTIYR